MVLRSEGIMTSGEGAMIVVDSSVWIDFFRGAYTPGRHMLREVLQQDDPAIVVPDLVLYEVLRGFRHARDYANARRLLEGFDVVPAFSPALACLAAEHYRTLVARGFTIRSALDVMIGTFCLYHDHLVLDNDRDFEVMERILGLRRLTKG